MERGGSDDGEKSDEERDRLADIFIYNDKFIKVNFPNLRKECEEVKLRSGKYHL